MSKSESIWVKVSQNESKWERVKMRQNEKMTFFFNFDDFVWLIWIFAPKMDEIGP